MAKANLIKAQMRLKAALLKEYMKHLNLGGGSYRAEEVAEILGLSRERVYNAEAVGIKIFKSPQIVKILREYTTRETA